LAQGPIQLVNQVEPELMVTANREQLLQVLTNLIRNALDALGEQAVKGRTPTVSVESRPLKGGQALVVRDNGPGIKPEHVARIFDPFFTTKDVGKGMGLGLTVCQGIMQAFGGNISVRSEPGKFCEFLLEFPPHS
jgi:two-component system sensor histidine kinase PhcS